MEEQFQGNKNILHYIDLIWFNMNVLILAEFNYKIELLQFYLQVSLGFIP